MHAEALASGPVVVLEGGVKSAFLLAEAADPFDTARASLQSSELAPSLAVGSDFLQLQDRSGRYFTVFGDLNPSLDWEFRDGPHIRAEGVRLPDMAAVSACFVECRWEDLFVAVIGTIARRAPHPLWVLDNADVVWAATAIDPVRLSL